MTRFITHRKTEPWGSSVMLMESEGKAFGRLYWYNGENVAYIEGLSVDTEFRNQGIGAKLLENFEEIGRNLDMTTFCLRVTRKSWTHAWYKRLGYEDLHCDKNDESTIWMKKSLAIGGKHDA